MALASLVCHPAPLPAQAHPGGRWWTIETSHFRVHVRPQHRELGLRAAAEAEAAWEALSGVLPAPYSPVELVVADDVDEANGLATTFPVPRIVVFATPPAADVVLATYDRWLRLVITHELAHIFHLDMARGWWAVARAALGRVPGLFPNEYAPTWLIEGVAVFYESRLTSAGRLGGSFHRGVVRAQAASGRSLPIDAAGSLSPRWPSGLRPYVFGGAFVGSLAERHGDSVVSRLARETATRPLPYVQLNGALGRVAGRSLTRAWREWQDSLVEAEASEARDEVAALPASVPQSGPKAPRLPALRAAVPPRLSADGRRLLLVLDEGRDVQRLATLELATGALRRLGRTAFSSGAAWDTGGAAVVAQLEFTDAYTLRSDLWRVGESGTRRLTHDLRLKQPAVGPDGAVYAVRLVPGGNELVRVEGGRAAAVVEAAPGVEWAEPVASPGPEPLLAATRVRDGRHDIVLLSPDGRVSRQLTDDAAIDRSPAFSPDGRLVFWSREVDGVAQIVGGPTDGSAAPRRFTRERFGAYAPAPAGDTVYYLAYGMDGWRLAATTLSEADPLPPAGPGAPPPEPPPAAPVRSEHPYRAFPVLWPKFLIPILEQQPGPAGWVGAFTAGTDALGRHLYLADAALGIGKALGEGRVHLLYLYAGRTNALFDLSYSRDPAIVDTGDSISRYRCCFTTEDLFAGVTGVRQRWRYGVAARLGAEYQRSGRFERWGPVVSFGLSSAAEPPVAVSPQLGGRLSATLRRRYRRTAAVYYDEALARGSAYFAFDAGGFSRHVLALRAAGGIRGGPDSLSQFDVGGVSSTTVELLPGVVFGGGGEFFAVRGHPEARLLGRSAAAFSVELRSPLALVGRGRGLFPAVLDRVSLSLFADGGAAWNPAYCPAESAQGLPRGCAAWIGSIGLELVTDLGVPWDFPIRLRAGAALTDRKQGAAFLALGPSF